MAEKSSSIKKSTNATASSSSKKGVPQKKGKTNTDDVPEQDKQTYLNLSAMGRSCQICRGNDDMEMVQCDHCDKWFHFSRVGVSQQVESQDWKCPKCVNAWTLRSHEQLEKAQSKAMSAQSEKLKIPQNQPLEYERNLQHEKAPSKAKSVKSNKTKQLQLKLLEEERKLQLEEEANKRKYLATKYALLKEIENEEPPFNNEEEHSFEKVQEWLEKTDLATANQGLEEHIVANPPERESVRPDASVRQETVVPSVKNSLLSPEEYPTDCLLTRRQLAARQAVSKELPTFSGNPEEWPIFLATFNNTTQLCGFSNDENLFRLQRCLKDKAYDAVKRFLLFPTNVPRIISTLKILFGQPEAIILSLINNISNIPALREDKLQTLVDFAISVQNLYATIEACGIHEYSCNLSLLHNLVDKLPTSMKLSWALHKQSLPVANLDAFAAWIFKLAEAASSVNLPSIPPSDVKSIRKPTTFVNTHSNVSSPDQYDKHINHNTNKPSYAGSSPSCIVCKANCTTIEKCKRFLELSYDARWATVEECNLCRKCLKPHKGGCRINKLCGINGCSFKHHELLHNDQKDQYQNRNAEPTNPQFEPQPSTSQVAQNYSHQSVASSVLFKIVKIVLYGVGTRAEIYALLDDGSSVTLLEQNLADELKAKGIASPLWLKWTGGTCRYEKDSRLTDLQIANHGNPGKRYTIRNVQTVNELLLPEQSMDVTVLKENYHHLRRLPLQSYRSIRPRMLIGANNAFLINTIKSKEGNSHDPIAVKTRLGWTIYGGRVTKVTEDVAHHCCHICETPVDDLHNAMKQFFAWECLGISKPERILISSEEEWARELLEGLTKLHDNRYETGLLWRYDNPRLPDSRQLAIRRTQCLQKRMLKDTILAKILDRKMKEYIERGYVRKLTSTELQEPRNRVWYLPVFPVTNPNKPDKVRLVWDAAAKVHDISLNALLLKGPDLLTSLVSILYQFREFRIALSGDIREMFHQIGINSSDQHCQRFFWPENGGELTVYIMQVMTFGACCSPSSAQYVMNKNAARFAQQFPAAVDVITRKHYVDDMLVSVESEVEAIELAKNVKYIHAQGGFETRNFISNSSRVLEALSEGSTTEKCLDLSTELSTEKVLGMWWCTRTDRFTYKINYNRFDKSILNGSRVPSKRELLRVLMTIFDPLGLISHFLMYLKVILQDVWRSQIGWDDPISDEQFSNWTTWLSWLPLVEKIQIPRCYRICTSRVVTKSSFILSWTQAKMALQQ
ncbi:uncharacterized protein LOC129766739 [Toxorhynchites rutilus septentrionalis]|uniref:uncharacterized protein LOC129766739 n=1 Tax=Toxorhynchites rutilus septentrionalis TaxID=329112 RepID=UPI00247B00AD|nr:uncharacterized protein LOC129766739 [Toxorhynchites rutilus septentrionalis]